MADRLASGLAESLPDLRGRMKASAALSELTWFRFGGPAELLYSPADETDLAYFLSNVPAEVPITIVGLGSNLLVRDGGIEGVVIRLGRGFGDVVVEENSRLRVGAAVPDARVARAAADAGIAGLAFYRGIPGCVGGALRMNGGAHGRETCEVVIEARAVDRQGLIHILPVEELDYSYRHCDGSIRKPRIFNCWSMRPRNSSSPVARWRTRSPVRYRRAPDSPVKGFGTNRSAVEAGRSR